MTAAVQRVLRDVEAAFERLQTPLLEAAKAEVLKAGRAKANRGKTVQFVSAMGRTFLEVKTPGAFGEGIREDNRVVRLWESVGDDYGFGVLPVVAMTYNPATDSVDVLEDW